MAPSGGQETGRPRLIGHVSTEGGPILIADHELIATWTGVDGRDYAELVNRFDADETPVVAIRRNGLDGLAWHVPIGTVDVWRLGQGSILLVRVWVDRDEIAADLAALPARDLTPLGFITISTGWLTILWAPENGAEAVSIDPADGLALNLSVGGSGLVATLPVGRYECASDEVEIGEGMARRCFIREIRPGGIGAR